MNDYYSILGQRIEGIIEYKAEEAEYEFNNKTKGYVNDNKRINK